MAVLRTGWNLAHGRDLFLDSWVLVHILHVLTTGGDLLPRGLLTLHYPLSFLPAWPLAEVLGPFATVKVVYPLLSSLSAVPAAMLVHGSRLALFGVAAMLLLPDLSIKALTGTPQGAALPLFLLALHLALQRRRLHFALVAAAVLFTHHLTGLITLVLFATVLVLPQCRRPGFFREQWPYLILFGLWPLYWAWTFASTEQWYLGPAFLGLAAAVGLPLVILLYLLMPGIDLAVHWAGQRIEALPAAAAWLLMAGAALSGAILAGQMIQSPGLAGAPMAGLAVMAVYGLVICAGLAAATVRRHTPLFLFTVTLLLLGLVNSLLGCARLFDGLRVVDYAAVACLVALFAPGLAARWARPGFLVVLALLVAVAGGLRVQAAYQRLFAHSEGQVAAARWVAEHTPETASVATDAKMSLLVLGEGNRNATFEGTWWLFTGESIAPYVSALNQDRRFRDRPIRYVLLSDYMFSQGADVTWFSPAVRAPVTLPARLDALGRRVFQNGQAAIWELNPDSIAAGAPQEGRVDFMAGFGSALSAVVAGGPCR